jgi:hypothetical protein
VRPLSCPAQSRGSSSCTPTEELETRRAERRLHPKLPAPLDRIRHITLIVVAALAGLAAIAPAALAANYHDAIRDCNDDGVLQGRYTAHTLRQARQHLPASLREYSDCADVLARALAAAARPGSGGLGGGNTAPPLGNPALTTGSGAIAPTVAQKNALEQQAKQSTSDRPPSGLAVGGHTITPGTAGLANAAAHTSPNDLPGPLLAALLALAAAGALAGGLSLRHRWPETRRVALRILRR